MATAVYPKNGHVVRQLIDHFEGNLTLTHTELLTIGMQCLLACETKPYAEADVVYAVMTLARLRPKLVKDESRFVAFAKLSLMNDTDRLMERLICLLPPVRGQPWYEIADFWKVRLWDILSYCQVAGIDVDQTVILDGGFGAAITWDRLPRVAFLKRQTVWRTVLEYGIRLAPGWLILGISALAQLPVRPNRRHRFRAVHRQNREPLPRRRRHLLHRGRLHRGRPARRHAVLLQGQVLVHAGLVHRHRGRIHRPGRPGEDAVRLQRGQAEVESVQQHSVETRASQCE
jgi:hypothetical protein